MMKFKTAKRAEAVARLLREEGYRVKVTHEMSGGALENSPDKEFWLVEVVEPTA